MSDPRVSIVMATHNRCGVLLDTLSRLERLAPPDTVEVIVVDNASSDGTVAAVRNRFPHVRTIARGDNRGSCAKTFGVDEARGEFVLFLDDDSFPDGASIGRMIEHFEADSSLGAAGFTVHLPDGTREGGALPDVFVGCGVGLRADALRDVGGLDGGMFMQAEEYDLSFRLAGGGWGVRVFGDLHVLHQKTPHARRSARTTFYDTRNNLMVVDRYLPDAWRPVYAADWRQRYRWLANGNGHAAAYLRGRWTAFLRSRVERSRFAANRLGASAFEAFFRLDDVRVRMAGLSAEGVRKIVLADLGKNVHAFHAGARQSGISVLGIADDRFFRRGRRYRGVPIVPTPAIVELHPDAVVISNMAAVHAAATRRRLSMLSDVPLHHWFPEPAVVTPPDFESIAPTNAADTPSCVSGTRSGRPPVPVC